MDNQSKYMKEKDGMKFWKRPELNRPPISDKPQLRSRDKRYLEDYREELVDLERMSLREIIEEYKDKVKVLKLQLLYRGYTGELVLERGIISSITMADYKDDDALLFLTKLTKENLLDYLPRFLINLLEAKGKMEELKSYLEEPILAKGREEGEQEVSETKDLEALMEELLKDFEEPKADKAAEPEERELEVPFEEPIEEAEGSETAEGGSGVEDVSLLEKELDSLLQEIEDEGREEEEEEEEEYLEIVDEEDLEAESLEELEEAQEYEREEVEELEPETTQDLIQELSAENRGELKVTEELIESQPETEFAPDLEELVSEVESEAEPEIGSEIGPEVESEVEYELELEPSSNLEPDQLQAETKLGESELDEAELEVESVEVNLGPSSEPESQDLSQGFIEGAIEETESLGSEEEASESEPEAVEFPKGTATEEIIEEPVREELEREIVTLEEELDQHRKLSEVKYHEGDLREVVQTPPLQRDRDKGEEDLKGVDGEMGISVKDKLNVLIDTLLRILPDPKFILAFNRDTGEIYTSKGIDDPMMADFAVATLIEVIKSFGEIGRFTGIGEDYSHIILEKDKVYLLVFYIGNVGIAIAFAKKASLSVILNLLNKYKARILSS